jgi:hypothetical protein
MWARTIWPSHPAGWDLHGTVIMTVASRPVLGVQARPVRHASGNAAGNKGYLQWILPEHLVSQSSWPTTTSSAKVQ